jgi:hypothetical protein
MPVIQFVLTEVTITNRIIYEAETFDIKTSVSDAFAVVESTPLA